MTRYPENGPLGGLTRAADVNSASSEAQSLLRVTVLVRNPPSKKTRNTAIKGLRIDRCRPAKEASPARQTDSMNSDIKYSGFIHADPPCLE
jgi:hypothetical protein